MKLVLSFLGFLFLSGASVFAAEAEVFDYLIKDATIFDGRSYTSFRADLGISGETISEVGDLTDREAFQMINAKGLVVSPGFIDAHTHSDFNPFIYPDLANKVEQGVTTEVIGNCGFSAAPYQGHHLDHMHGVWIREGVQIPEKIEWGEYKEYLSAMAEAKPFHNYVGLVGHGNLRSIVMGMDPRAASPSELQEMKRLMSEAMESGAMGISFGLVYLPGIFANEKEVVELCRETAKHGGACAFHIRSEGANLLEAIKEVIRVAKQAQARVQISHFKAGGGKKNWKKIDKAFELIENARLEGVEVVADVYPYTAGFAELGVVLPDEMYTNPDRVKLFKSKKNDLKFLNQLRDYYEIEQMKWNWIRIASTPNKKYWPMEGKSIEEIAIDNNIEPEKFLIDILGDSEFEVSAFYFSQSPKVVNKVIKKPYVTIGSDSVADGSRRPHPRAFGTFTKVLRKYVREDKVLRLGEAIRKMTSLPADQFKLVRRGEIKVGNYADLVLFDASQVEDSADYANPSASNAGIRWVFVNGNPVLAEGKLTGERPGRLLTLDA